MVSDERVGGRFEEVEGRDLGVPQNILDREDEREECFNPEEEIVFEVMGEAGREERDGLFSSGRPLDAHVFPLHDGWTTVPHPRPVGVVVDGVRFRVDIAYPKSCEASNSLCSVQSSSGGAIPYYKFFFADDTEWDKTDAEVENLSRWKAKGLNLNEYSLTSGELEDVRMLERGGVEPVELASLRRGGGRGPRWEGEVRGPVLAKRRRMEQQNAREEVMEPATSSLPIEAGPSTTVADVAVALREQGYIRLQTTSFYDSGMRSIAKRFINAYFPEVDRQCAKDKVAARGSVGVVRQALETVNLVNVLSNEHHESLRDRNQLRKENVELVKKNEEAEVKVAKLKTEMEELRKENATLKKDSELSYKKRKICEDELEKKEKELDEVVRVAAELELKVHNSVEEHVAGFLKSNTFEDIVKLYWLSTTIVAFFDCQKKWNKENKGRTILPSNFSFEFIPAGDEGTEGANNPDQPAE
ncbi:hypothetical protein SLEP1_g21092 [Rubroshorea leprosula]|uniref:Uncharacterized protein n=1 Tax=Rubroshorea leprosula TaxID=152421 RepID=A0AAV5JCA5_9ROSI|nr:hypothetical protein SLEP1_g21092 [Rubroshorea leprosula]